MRDGKSVEGRTRSKEDGVAEGGIESSRVDGFPFPQHPNGGYGLVADEQSEE